MDEQQEQVEGKRSWLRSWKVWLVSVLLLVIVPACLVPLIRLQRQQAAVAELKKQGVTFSYEPAIRPTAREYLDDWGIRFGLLEIPNVARISSASCDAQMFEQLGKLPLIFLYMRDQMGFQPDDLRRLIEQSPSMESIRLCNCRQLPTLMVNEIQRDRPTLEIEQYGLCLTDFVLFNTPSGLQVAGRAPWADSIWASDVVLAMDGQPLDSYHEVKRAIEGLAPGEQLRFTVVGQNGKKREEIYTAPQP
ncbi:MAG: hypothetical protein CMJ47_00275 [Planctomyces sp.]|nr:hypothetical protein [Planctomyces sp.]